jgi:uncharacterized cupin superfamily protein
MRVASIDEPHWDAERPEPHSLRAARVGAQAGAQAIGATLYELAPGGAVSPYHVHHANEELLIVLAGRPRLRTPEGTTTLETGSVVAFAPGHEGAHRISNAGPEPARVLVCSTMNLPEIAEYPDTGTWLAVTSRSEGTGRPEGRAFPAGSDVPIADAIAQAMEEGAARELE